VDDCSFVVHSRVGIAILVGIFVAASVGGLSCCSNSRSTTAVRDAVVLDLVRARSNAFWDALLVEDWNAAFEYWAPRALPDSDAEEYALQRHTLGYRYDRREAPVVVQGDGDAVIVRYSCETSHPPMMHGVGPAYVPRRERFALVLEERWVELDGEWFLADWTQVVGTKVVPLEW
jgi:hypothetical protein